MAALPTPSPPASRPLLWLLMAVSLAAWIPFVAHTALYVQYPFSLDETEGYVLGQVHRLSIGGRLYGPIDEWPYVVDNYPPAFPVLLSGLEGILGREYRQPALLPVPGVADDDERSVGVKAATFAHHLPRARSLVLLIALGIGGLLTALWRGRGATWSEVALGLTLWIAQPAVFFMCPLTRADWPALLCGIAALWLAQRGLALPTDRPWLSGSAVVGMLALLFRQSAIVPVVAIALTLGLAKDRRFTMFLGVAAATGLVMALALHLTYGLDFWLHITAYTKTRWLPDRLLGTWGFFMRHSSLWLVLAGLGWWTLRREEGWTLPVIYAPLALATGLLSGKVGSDMNYFLEPILGGILVTGLAFRYWRNGGQQWPAWVVAGSVMVLLQSAVVQNPRAGSYRPTRYDLANGTELLLQLQQVQGVVLSEEEGIVALAGKEVGYNPFIMAELEREGVWDDTPLVEQLNARVIPVVIVLELPDPNRAVDRGRGAGWDRWTPAMQQALQSHYRPVVGVPFRRDWIVMVPRTGPARSEPLQSRRNE